MNLTPEQAAALTAYYVLLEELVGELLSSPDNPGAMDAHVARVRELMERGPAAREEVVRLGLLEAFRSSSDEREGQAGPGPGPLH